MRIWLATTGEPTPLEGSRVRLYRTGMLAMYLANAGHRVTWWTSDFNHHSKKHRIGRNAVIVLAPQLRLVLMHGCGYRRHVSIRRIVDHIGVSLAFRSVSSGFAAPDVIVAAYPTIELASACVSYGRKHSIPVALDIRDLWPDTFLDQVPQGIRRIASGLLWPYDVMARSALSEADAIFSITDPILDWGLAKARRCRGPLDEVISFGYSPYIGNDISTDIAYWRDLGLDPVRHVIGCFFGTLGKQFQINTIISAARVLAHDHAGKFLFVICGDGEMLPVLRREASDVPSVIFPGWVDSRKIAALMELASFGIAPYRSTPDFEASIPNKPIEYLSGGLPIVSSLRGLLEKLISKYDVGRTYDAHDVMGFIAAIRAIEIEIKTTDIKVRCRRVFSERFHAKSTLVQYANAISKLAMAGRCLRKGADSAVVSTSIA